MNPTSIVIAALSALLLASLGANAWQYHEHDKLVTTTATAEQFGRDVTAAAKTCSDSVDHLAAAGRQQHADAMAVIGAQRPAIDRLQLAANASLLAQPIDPTNLCHSLEVYLRTQIQKERSQP